MLQVSVLEFVVVEGSPPAGGKGCETQMEVEETASGVSHFLDHVELKQKTKIGFPFKGGMLAQQTAEGLNKGRAKVKDGYQKMKTRRRTAWNC